MEGARMLNYSLCFLLGDMCVKLFVSVNPLGNGI